MQSCVGRVETTMDDTTGIFGLRVGMLPLLNVRIEFNRNHRILNSPEFRAQIVHWKPGVPIHAEYMVWGGDPAVLLNWILQRTIVGVEAYIPSAVLGAAMHYGRFSERVKRGVNDPFSLKCLGAANTFYNCLPGLVDLDFRMICARGRLWKDVNRFYREIRNPLFHGYQLCSGGYSRGDVLDSVLRASEFFGEVYKWVDWWFPPRLLETTGPVRISEPPRLTNLP